jgi:hypothetical protein
MLYTNPSGGRADFEAYARAVSAATIAPTGTTLVVRPLSPGASIATRVLENYDAEWNRRIAVYHLSREERSLARATTTPAGSDWEEPHREDREFSKALAFVSAMLGRNPNVQAVRQRLHDLWSAAKAELADGGVLLSVQSIESFARFLSRLPRLMIPELVMTPTGHLRAEWRGSDSQFLGVEFQGASETKIILFAKDPNCRSKLTRLSQSISASGLLKVLQTYDINWASNV